MEAIRILIAFAAHMEVKLFQMDVKTALLNGNSNKEVYVKKPLPALKIQYHQIMCWS